MDTIIESVNYHYSSQNNRVALYVLRSGDAVMNYIATTRSRHPDVSFDVSMRHASLSDVAGCWGFEFRFGEIVTTFPKADT